MTDTATVEPTEGGLLDNVQVEDNTQAANPDAAQIDHKAATPGGDVPGTPKAKPEYLPDNFWDADKGEAKYEALAKSWSDLRKTISQGKHKAPEDGKYDAKAFGDNAENNPIAGTLTEWAKENGLSQAQFDDLATKLREKSQEVMGDMSIDPAQELKALGPNAHAIVDGMANWARGLVNKGVLSKDDFEEFKIMGGTARGINVLLKIREAYEGRVPIEAAKMDGAPSKEELYAMVGDPKYKTDAAYRQRVERLFQASLG